ncbi:UDP-GlcNAc3NAcA epimerase [Bradyrhizobium japonicum]|uniref:non-hydrolyzing UDP-N-acetylglucosamine 2-epimerase n=1 Tax=Bradyrhizobium elkanii TaxID=29448 RepID=UPI000475B273|nr:UDP-N-acetylglucosamine 2-epimerase (non-hydrolyzing) [Bradyrhizobium elkanii]NWL42738.1 UDP-N-acetylglucosamine 2-epimerase (non-hydrolyzing) [Bradyrhizobium elkanii]RYM18487.1 UDP-N-acetylglucosamine 2-epimerase (non-hydrolyzing) [Bradyrhizobium elkanii]UQD84215.1 UDP-N-acetylglucosamine 2-epimerase (non-hydrolyzing) [Bradyrhizobium elkanii USDA 76]WLB69523.1 UDP-N-acetylglucosamine 2-epimerase (non-hydrolyzing) [Bradyrhizobium elkanii]
MRRIISVVGARPQFVKAAVVAHAFAAKADVDHYIVHTGQHFDGNMSDVFFAELQIPAPRYRLAVHGLSHGAMTGRMLEQIESIFLTERPEAVVVYGDTNSTLAGALAAVKLHIPVAHVEAGLRSANRAMPEEINRIATDHVSDVLFTPNETALRQLLLEGLSESSIENVGDVMFDACLRYGASAEKKFDPKDYGLECSGFTLATIHRAENTDDRTRLAGIFEGLRRSGRPVLLPLHPRTRDKLTDYQLAVPSNVTILDPVGFMTMLQLERYASCIATDSGGVQKEAFFMRKPCVTMRDETEWTELVESGWNTLVGADPDRISSAIREARGPTVWPNFYGDGHASEKVVERVLSLCAERGQD